MATRAAESLAALSNAAVIHVRTDCVFVCVRPTVACAFVVMVCARRIRCGQLTGTQIYTHTHK